MAKLYTGDMQEQEILENFILSQRAGETHYLCSEIATYILLEIGVYSAKIDVVIQPHPPSEEFRNIPSSRPCSCNLYHNH